MPRSLGRSASRPRRCGAGWTAASCPRTARGRRPPSRTRASSPACASAATRCARSPRRRRPGGSRFAYIEDLLPTRGQQVLDRRRGARDRAGARADRARLHDDGPQPGRGAADQRGRPAAAALRRRGRWRRASRSSRFLQLDPRLRPGDRADRRRRGAPLPPLRARAADARRRAGPRDGRGDGGPGRRAAAARLADHGPRPPALPAALRRAGRDRAHGGRPRRRAARPRPPARRDRVRRPRRLHAADRGDRARRRRSARSSASSRTSSTRCPTTRA